MCPWWWLNSAICHFAILPFSNSTNIFLGANEFSSSLALLASLATCKIPSATSLGLVKPCQVLAHLVLARLAACLPPKECVFLPPGSLAAWAYVGGGVFVQKVHQAVQSSPGTRSYGNLTRRLATTCPQRSHPFETPNNPNPNPNPKP